MSKQRTKKQRSRARSSSATIAIATVTVLLIGGGGLFYSSTRHAAPLERVSVDHVCMVNDKYFPDRQIPVPVGSKTYFGCCEMCKGRLSTDQTVRIAKDPVSGNPVDKSDAVIGALPNGRVLYFENEDTLAAYNDRTP